MLIDLKNPQAAARLVLPLTRFNNYSKTRQEKIRQALDKIYKKDNLSSDLLEIVEKALR